MIFTKTNLGGFWMGR